MMDQATLASLTGSVLLTVPGTDAGDDSISEFASPASAMSQASVNNYSSLGSCAGAAVSRNLMEELSQIRSYDGTEESNYAEQGESDFVQEDHEYVDETEIQDSFSASEPLEPIPESHSREASDTTNSTATVVGLQPCASSATPTAGLSFIARLRLIFGNLWTSPVELARHLLQNAQSRMRLPAPLRNVQWWLVSVLLGPMAKRRLLSAQRDHAGEDENDCRRLLIGDRDRSPSSDDLAYGTFYPSSPEAASSKQRTPSGMAGPGKKRSKHRNGSKRAQQHQQQLVGIGPYSPWMWLKFSITLAFAIGCAFRSGPGSLLMLNDSEKRCICPSCSNSKRRERLATPSS